MTQVDFDRWWADLTLRFASVESWLVRTFPTAVEQKTLLRTWRDVLADCDLLSAMEVNREMQAGNLEWPGGSKDSYGFEERLPQHVRRLARQWAYENRSDRPIDDEPRRPSSFPAGKIYRRILELTDKGVPSDEAKQLVLSELSVGKPNWEPRFSCRICFDVGMVTVASRSAIESMFEDTFERCHHRAAAMLCSCRGHLAQNPKRPRCVYDPSLDFKIEDYLWGRSEVERFREWVEAKRNEYWESKRDPSFDRFNQREFA